MKEAYIFRGAPASGKGTITRAFIKTLPGKVALLELDNFRWSFHARNREVEEIAPEEHLFAYENFLMMLESYCKNGNYTIVVEGLSSWDTPGPHGNMQEILAILKRYDFKTKAFLLYSDYDALWQRNMLRDHVVPEGEFKELYDYVIQKVSDDEIKIDTGKGTVEEIVETIKQS